MLVILVRAAGVDHAVVAVFGLVVVLVVVAVVVDSLFLS